ncbi:heparan-alpha-glucosaminide N-acetyltransferase domain-containing protein [Rapidithrix thailandica]|uniref:Heparan-alpha-glucosaminide N-acetyltransferase domain-containing protein n=1 Tax=Rapidithrix thailandica TaxID=413964 RepID=A0AAW9SHP3_9BACT
MQKTTQTRLLSLDIFRGLTVAGMILVNNPGSWGHIYAPLRHASWHGCTPTDLVFPFFLFIVGISISLAYTKRKKAGVSPSSMYGKIFSRTAKLILLGLFLSAFTIAFPFFKDWEAIRIPGVLQRIGLVFMVASLLFLHCSWRSILLIFVGLLVGYWALMSFVPVPGAGEANYEPTTNLAAWLDRLLMEGHLWKKAWDPEGLLSTLPAIGTALFGILIGKILLQKSLTEFQKIQYFLGIGLGGILLGMLWDPFFPINKGLWTSSYVLFTGGLASTLFGMIYAIADVWKKQDWGNVFVVYGSNAITVFFLSGLIAKTFYQCKWTNGEGSTESLHGFLYQQLYTSWISVPELSSLMYALTVVVFYYLVLYVMYRKKIFVKL